MIRSRILAAERFATLENAAVIAGLINQEAVPLPSAQTGNMLAQTAEGILGQMRIPEMSFLAVADGEIVGFITLWEYGLTASTGRPVGELGSWVVGRDFRHTHLGTGLVESLVASQGEHFEMVATTKTYRAREILRQAGFEVVRYEFLDVLAERSWEECCPCYPPADSHQSCALNKSTRCQLVVYQPERVPGFCPSHLDTREASLIVNNQRRSEYE